jgi:hypothetical protein
MVNVLPKRTSAIQFQPALSGYIKSVFSRGLKDILKKAPVRGAFFIGQVVFWWGKDK